MVLSALQNHTTEQSGKRGFVMEFALDEKQNRINALEADKSREYHCPLCFGKVIPRQGECNHWHFAHRFTCEDHWTYDMSEWHIGWQEKFPEETREAVVEYQGKKHRADILVGNTVIEFQHSAISAAEFAERNTFYTSAGYKVIWVFDVVQLFRDELICGSDSDNAKFSWRHPSRVLSSVIPQSSSNVAIVLELDDGLEDDGEPWIVKVEWAKPSCDGDFADYSVFFIEDNFAISFETSKDIDEIFLNKWQRFKSFLMEHQPYMCKCGREKGHPRPWYICEKTNEWHDGACTYCPYNLVTEYRRASDNRKGGRTYYSGRSPPCW
jgi:hypothetical protein